MARALAPHGTVAAYKRHLRAGESACADCLRAKREHEHERRRRAAAEAVAATDMRVELPEGTPAHEVQFSEVDLEGTPDDGPPPPRLTDEALNELRRTLAEATGQRDRPEEPDLDDDDGEQPEHTPPPLGLGDAAAIAALPVLTGDLEPPDRLQELLALRAVLWQSMRITAITEPTRVAGITRELRAIAAEVAALSEEQGEEVDPFSGIADDDAGNVFSITGAPPGASTG